MATAQDTGVTATEGTKGATEGEGRRGRRGILAVAAAAAAGIAANTVRTPVEAADGNNIVIGTNNTGTSQTNLFNTGTPTHTFLASANSSAIVAVPAAIAGNGGTTKTGIYGFTSADSNYGIVGSTFGTNSTGVYGRTDNIPTPNVGGAGVTGEGNNTNFGVKGISEFGTGVYGTTAGAYGLLGQTGTAGTFGLYGSGLANGAVAVGSVGYNGALAAQFSGPVRVYGQIILQQGSGGPGNAFVVGPGVTKNAAVRWRTARTGSSTAWRPRSRGSRTSARASSRAGERKSASTPRSPRRWTWASSTSS